MSPISFGAPINVKPRRFDKGITNTFFDQLRRSAGQQQQSILAGTDKRLAARGFSKSGQSVAAVPAAANAFQQTFQRGALPYSIASQNFTEGARRFDTSTEMEKRRLWLANQISLRNQPGLGDLLGAGVGIAANVAAPGIGRMFA